MDPAWISALSGLVGAVIGGVGTFAGTVTSNRHADEQDRRALHRELLAQFWDAADRMWRNSELYERRRQDVIYERGRTPLSPLLKSAALATYGRSVSDGHEERLRALMEERDAHHDAYVAADNDAGVLLGRMRLLALLVVPEAEELRKCARFVNVDDANVQSERHDAALAAYEKKGAALND